ncbi:MAG: S8 family serine peptidase, partial [Bacteroidales bacterium]
FPPEILSYENNILSGTSAPNDTIEIFASTGEQNANEYLTSTTTGPDSTWSVEVTTTYPYFIATATDMDNNTSEMSGVMEAISYPTPQPTPEKPKWVKDELYVTIKEESDIDLLEDTAIISEYGVTKVRKPFDNLNNPYFQRYYRVKFTDTLNIDTILSEILEIDCVEKARKIPVMYSFINCDDEDDPQYDNAYYDLVNGHQACEIYNSVISNVNPCKVAVVDDAVLTSHEDLVQNIGNYNYDVADNNNDPNPPLNEVSPDYFSHGTHVAGIAGGVSYNNIGIKSLGWNNELMCIKTLANDNTLPPGNLNLADCYEGINYAAHHGAKVINMSWGSSISDSVDHLVLKEIKDSFDVIFVAAAGNSYSSEPKYPAAYGEGLTGESWEEYDPSFVISVAAIDDNNNLAIWDSFMGSISGSNFGDGIDISAYGTDIWSTVADALNDTTPINNNYLQNSGTSMAAPVVSAIVGHMRSYKPDATSEEIYNCLVNTANDDIYDETLHPDNFLYALGAGRLDAEAALKCLGVDCTEFDPLAVISPISNFLCPGNGVTLTANEGIAYQWSTGDTVPAITVDEAGTYSVTVTFEGDCMDSTSFELNEADDMEIPLIITEDSGLEMSDGIVCSNNGFQICSYNANQYYWEWEYPENIFHNDTSPCMGMNFVFNTINVNGVDTIEVTLEVSGFNSCPGITRDTSVNIIILEAPTAKIILPTEDTNICVGNSLQLIADTIGGYGGISEYYWTGDNQFLNDTTILNPVFYANDTGEYNLSFRVYGNNGCWDFENITIKVYENPNVIIQPDSIEVCEGEEIIITESGYDDSIMFWTWVGPNNYGNSTSVPYDTITSFATSAMSGTYYVIGTNLYGCSSIDSINISVFPIPLALAGSNSPVCENEDILLTETGGDDVSWSWSGPDGFTSTNQYPSISSVTTAAGGTYTVTVTDANGCTATDEVTITVYDIPTVIAGSNSPICVGDDINSTETGDDSDVNEWSWGGPNSFTSTEQNPTITSATIDANGTYTVTVTDVNGCTNADNVNVTVNALPAASAGSNSPLCEGEDLLLTESGGEATSWSWSGPDGFSSTEQNPTITSATTTANGTYIVTVTNVYGCTASDAMTVTVVDCSGLDLFSKNTDDDYGSEPYSGTGNIWYSPDLVNRQFYEDPETVPMVEEGVQYDPVAGAPNFMYVKVHNRGNIDYLASTGGSVELYWTRARSGEDWPTHWDEIDPDNQENGDSQGGQLATVPIDKDIPIGGEEIFYAQWSPPDPETLTSSTIEFSNGLPMICYLSRIIHPADSMVYEDPGPITPHVRQNNNVVSRNSWIETLSKSPELPYAGPVFWLSNPDDEEIETSLIFEPVDEPDGSTFFDWGEITIHLAEAVFQQWNRNGAQGNGFKINSEDNSLLLTGNQARIDGIILEPGADYPVMVTFDLKKLANPLEDYNYQYVIRTFNQTDGKETVGFNFNITIKPPDHFLAEITDSTYTSCAGACDGSATVTAFGGVPPYSYQWESKAGNQTTVSASDLCEGIYSVVVTDAEGTTAVAQVHIQADPALFNYPGETTLTTNTDWNSVSYTINDTIFVPADITLSITNSTIEFGTYGRIWVHKGGKLIVDNSKLSNLSSCKNLWGGIVMVGDHHLEQPLTDPLLAGYPQSFALIKNNSIIENARIGIFLGNPWYKDTRMGSGGVLWMESGSKIRNCYYGVEFKAYPHQNRTHFTDCEFVCNAPIPHPAYKGAGTRFFVRNWGAIGLSFENVSFTNTGKFSVSERGVAFNSFATQKSTFKNCHFTDITTGFKGSFYSTEITGCDFTNMTQGIAIKQYIANLGNNIIDGNTFTNVREGVYIQGGYMDDITNNTFSNIHAMPGNDAYGVYLVSTGAFHVDYNIFSGYTSALPKKTPASYGVVVENSGKLGGIVFNNGFSGTDFGIQTQDINENLVIRCNSFSDIGTYGFYVYDGSLKQQGKDCNSTHPPNRNENQAGNEWLGVCTDAQELFINKHVRFDYFAHYRAADNSEATVPDCSSPVWKENHLKVCEVKKTSTSCNSFLPGLPAEPPATSFSDYLAAIDTKISENKTQIGYLKSEVPCVIANTDGGNT